MTVAWVRGRLLVCARALAVVPAHAQERRKVYIDQDCAGPGGTDMQAILAILNAPDTDVLGIGVLTGDQWRDEEIQHTLRLLEIVGRTEIPVLPGAVFPLISSKEYIAKWETLHGKILLPGRVELPPHGRGARAARDPANARRRAVDRGVRGSGCELHDPHGATSIRTRVTIYAAGPMTNLAVALTLDPHFPELTKELIVMGGVISPVTSDPQFGPAPGASSTSDGSGSARAPSSTHAGRASSSPRWTSR